ncbi:ead/Ea22-like family protein [Serratia bockelmannii]|uniref:ead/Ea22-like family protein n=1 Tax=Serratia bockelmannii TaxID=2703793 RepID=UPI002FE5525A
MMDNKLSELKAAAMAATPGPWILDDDSWSEGDNANVSTEERYDGRIVSIAQIEGGGSESGFDEPFSAEQQANARYITAANPAVVLALLAELEAKDKRIAELEAKLATPVRLPPLPEYRHNDRHEVRAEKDGFISGVEESASALREQGFTVEGDE